MARSRFPIRIAAVSALAIGAVVLFSILSSGLEDGGEGQPANGTAIDQPEASGERERPARYVVQNGDTLIDISERTGVSVSRLQELNPGIDPQLLRSGQRLRLR